MTPENTPLMEHSDRGLLVKILAELRVQTMLMAQEFNAKDDINALRNEAMTYANQTILDL